MGVALLRHPVLQLLALACLVTGLRRFALLRCHPARVRSALALFSQLLRVVVVGLRVRLRRHALSPFMLLASNRLPAGVGNSPTA